MENVGDRCKGIYQQKVASIYVRRGRPKRCRVMLGGFVVAPLLTLQSNGIASAQEGEGAAVLQEIVVTATRTERSLSTVPVSISALSQQQMDQQGIRQVDDLFKFTPGVSFQRAADNTTEISIRGISSESGAATTGIYIDDTPIQIPRAAGSFSTTNAYPEIFDLQRVEVLRGPQGTLFGAGALGGAVRFITPQPSLQDYSLYSRSEVSFTENGDPNYELGIAGGGPIIDNVLGFRASVNYRRDEGWIDRIPRVTFLRMHEVPDEPAGGEIKTHKGESNANWREAIAARLALSFAPMENLRITPSVYYQQVYNNGKGYYWDAFSNRDKGEYVNGANSKEPDRSTWSLSSLNMTYDVSNVTIVSNTSYFDVFAPLWQENSNQTIQRTPAGADPSLSPTNWVAGYPDFSTTSVQTNDYEAFTQEIRAQSADQDARLQWVIGAFYQRSNTIDTDHIYVNAEMYDRLAQGLGYPDYLTLFRGTPLIDGTDAYSTWDKQTTTELAGFLNVDYEVVDRLSLSAGLRLSKLELDGTALQGGPYALRPTLSGFTGNQAESSLSPKFGVSYQATQSDLFYANAAKGFRGGGVNQPLPSTCDPVTREAGFSSPPNSYDSDTLWNYEVGAKNRFLDGHLSVNSSVFWGKWSDIQQKIYFGSSCNRAILFNAATAVTKGFDLSVEAIVAKALTLRVAVGYTEAKFDQSLLGFTGPGEPSRILINKGDWVQNVTPWTASVSARHEMNVFNQDAFWQVDYQFQSRDPEAPNFDPVTTSYQPSAVRDPKIELVSARVGMSLWGGGAQVSLFAENLLNAHPYIQFYAVEDQFHQSVALRPRTIGLDITYRY